MYSCDGKAEWNLICFKTSPIIFRGVNIALVVSRDSRQPTELEKHPTATEAKVAQFLR